MVIFIYLEIISSVVSIAPKSQKNFDDDLRSLFGVHTEEDFHE